MNLRRRWGIHLAFPTLAAATVLAACGSEDSRSDGGKDGGSPAADAGPTVDADAPSPTPTPAPSPPGLPADLLTWGPSGLVGEKGAAPPGSTLEAHVYDTGEVLSATAAADGSFSLAWPLYRDPDSTFFFPQEGPSGDVRVVDGAQAGPALLLGPAPFEDGRPAALPEPSCEDRSRAASRAVAFAAQQADAGCVTDSDCVVVERSTRCGLSCTRSVVARTAADAVAAERAHVEDWLCDGFEAACAPSELGCAPTRLAAACVDARCVAVQPTARVRFMNLGRAPNVVPGALNVLASDADGALTYVATVRDGSTSPYFDVPLNAAGQLELARAWSDGVEPADAAGWQERLGARVVPGLTGADAAGTVIYDGSELPSFFDERGLAPPPDGQLRLHVRTTRLLASLDLDVDFGVGPAACFSSAAAASPLTLDAPPASTLAMYGATEAHTCAARVVDPVRVGDYEVTPPAPVALPSTPGGQVLVGIWKDEDEPLGAVRYARYTLVVAPVQPAN